MCVGTLAKNFPLSGAALAQKSGVTPLKGFLMTALENKRKKTVAAAPKTVGTVPIDTTLSG